LPLSIASVSASCSRHSVAHARSSSSNDVLLWRQAAIFLISRCSSATGSDIGADGSIIFCQGHGRGTGKNNAKGALIFRDYGRRLKKVPAPRPLAGSRLRHPRPLRKIAVEPTVRSPRLAGGTASADRPGCRSAAPGKLVLRLNQMVHTAKLIMPAIPAAGSRWSVVGVNLSSVSEH
jgi:hypothetical protein